MFNIGLKPQPGLQRKGSMLNPIPRPGKKCELLPTRGLHLKRNEYSWTEPFVLGFFWVAGLRNL